jgi:hypothetical protein
MLRVRRIGDRHVQTIKANGNSAPFERVNTGLPLSPHTSPFLLATPGISSAKKRLFVLAITSSAA